MKNKINIPIKRRNSNHTQIRCKSKLQLKLNNNINYKQMNDIDQNISIKNNCLLINQKVKNTHINHNNYSKPIIKKIPDLIKDSMNVPVSLKKKQKIICKSTKNSNGTLRNAKNCNSKIRNENSKFFLDCSKKKIKSKYLSGKELPNEYCEEKKSLENEYKDDKIEILYNSVNDYVHLSATQKGWLKNKVEKENNQDVSLIIENVCGIKNFNIYSIMDGHGSNGHHISNYIKEKIYQYLNNISFYFHKITNTPMSEEYPEDILELIKKTLTKNNFQKIKDFYKFIDEGLSSNDIHFDINFSGSTCIILFKIGNYLICSNVGDSRAIMINEKNEIIELSKDQKPENENERKRIESMGGIISQCNDLYDDGKEGGPYRIWVKGCDYPGISMSRSIGDKISHDIGVISEPEILDFNIDNKSECLVIGSDGIWQFLKNEDVVDIIRPFMKDKKYENVCKEVIRKASLGWIENDSVMDDITFIIVFLKV
jgi:serine/threonine protein phosphatase PrpC